MFFLLVDLIQQLLALFFPYVILLLIYPFRYQKKKSQIDLKSTAPTKKTIKSRYKFNYLSIMYVRTRALYLVARIETISYMQYNERKWYCPQPNAVTLTLLLLFILVYPHQNFLLYIIF